MTEVIAPKGPKKKISREQMEKLKELGHKPVKGIFRCHEVPGGSLKFSFKAFPGDPVETYNLEDGKIYTLPLMVAKHINTNCGYDIHQFVMDADGTPIVSKGRRQQRYRFESLDFTDYAEDDE